MWMLILAVAALPLIVNLCLWRLDLAHLRVLAASRKPVPSLDLPDGRVPKVSFLVPAWNRESTLRSCIEAIQQVHYAGIEIILCAGGTDRTWMIASELNDPRLILLAQQAGEGKQRSLERCLEKATGEIVYLLDADGYITAEAFARLIGPILSGDERVVTNSPYTPYPEWIGNPFVVSQCASQLYTSIHQPEYSSGLLGSNSAIQRRALEQSGGFRADVSTGVDYHLGKRLLRQGNRVRYEVDGSFPTGFHLQVRPYLRQQTRWMRNVVIHGIHFHAWREVIPCLATSLIGLAMLVLPCLWLMLVFSAGVSPAVPRIVAAVWACALLHAFLSRLRYLTVAERRLSVRFPRRMPALLPLFMLIDFIAWTIPLIQYPSRTLRERW
jgi:cellulose synthase/poly-beta-1,6-N-acetylglucosamine synthase-like glycosyltransferase